LKGIGYRAGQHLQTLAGRALCGRTKTGQDSQAMLDRAQGHKHLALGVTAAQAAPPQMQKRSCAMSCHGCLACRSACDGDYGWYAGTSQWRCDVDIWL